MPSDAVEAFRSHRQYLRALTLLAGFDDVGFGNPGVHRTLAHAARACAPERRTGDTDLAQVKASLTNAWSTELLLGLSGQFAADDEFVRVTNNWAAVQAYYVGYHATQALCVAKGMSRPPSHPKTLSQYSAIWLNPHRGLGPSTLGAGPSGRYVNVPDGRMIDEEIHPWSRCDESNCASLAPKAIRTTREDAVIFALARGREAKARRRRQEWIEEEQQRTTMGRRPRRQPSFPTRLNLNAGERSEIESRVRSYTVLDYLYQLRIRSNYEDATMFQDGPEDDRASTEVHRNLRRLSAGLGLIHEVHVGSLIGTATLRAWADHWVAQTVPGGVPVGLALRIDLL